MIDVQNKKLCIFGIQCSGKTELAKHIIRHFQKPMIYEVNPDMRNTNAYIYRPTSLTLDELDEFCLKVKKLAKLGKINLFVLDEADMFFRSNFDLMPKMNDLIINHRHYNLSLLFVSRRPQDIPSKIIESSHHIFVFSIDGVNAIEKLSKLHKGFKILLGKLEYEKYNFIHKAIGQAPILRKAIKISKDL